MFATPKVLSNDLGVVKMMMRVIVAVANFLTESWLRRVSGRASPSRSSVAWANHSTTSSKLPVALQLSRRSFRPGSPP